MACWPLMGAAAAILLVRDPTPPAGMASHTLLGAIMYLQLAATHLGAAVVFSLH